MIEECKSTDQPIQDPTWQRTETGSIGRCQPGGKYQRLYKHLCALQAAEWRSSFGEIESVLGFELPPSARRHRQWWENQSSGKGHSHALAWIVAGWETADVDMAAETLLLRRRNRPDDRSQAQA